MEEFSFPIGEACVRIDLHGCSVQDARNLVKDIVKATYYQRECYLVHVITGRGNHVNSSGSRGVLYHKMTKWLSESDIADMVKDTRKGLGAYFILLNRRKLSITAHIEGAKDDAYEKILREKALSGNSQAQFELGHSLFKKLEKKSLKWLQKAAQQGHTEAMLLLGFSHAMGVCGARYNAEEAISWYTKAANEQSIACTNLAMMYWFGEGVEIDLEQAVQWYKRAEKLGSITAQRYLGILLRRLGLDEEAVIWDTKGSANNDHPAQVNLGCMYETGRGIAKDEGKAVELYRAAAEGGENEGKMRLAFAFANGMGVKQDYKAAARLALEVALKYNDNVGADCQYLLAKMYACGLGFAVNVKLAEQWLHRAASSGHAEAVKVQSSVSEGDLGALHFNSELFRQVEQNADFFEMMLKAINQDHD